MSPGAGSQARNSSSSSLRPRSRNVASSSKATSKWSSIALLPRPVTK
jgi:hypothetical protein